MKIGNLQYLEALTYGSYGLTLFTAYMLISLIFYMIKDSEIKLLKQTYDPKKFRNRNKLNSTIELAAQQKKMSLLWPIFLIKGLQENGKKEEK